jgi:hypothetical protein
MKLKNLPILFLAAGSFLLLFFGCATGGGTVSDVNEMVIENIPFSETMEREAGRLWTTLPVDGSPVFIGYSVSYFDKDREEFEALKTAAAYASSYFWLYGETGFLDSRKGQFSYTEIDYDVDRSQSLVKDLEIIDKYTDKRGTVLAAKLKGAGVPNYGFNPIPSGYKRGKAPDWTVTMPKVPGYHAAVGVADKKFDLATSFLTADKQALAELLRQVNLKTVAGQAEQTIDVVGQINTQVSSQRSQAELQGVYVLARYQSEDGKYFYTLAVCPKN